MSTNRYTTELPDPVYGSADTGPGINPRRLSVGASDTTTANLLHAHIGGIYIAMSERNWGILFQTLQRLEVPNPAPTYRINFDDVARTATITLDEVTA